MLRNDAASCAPSVGSCLLRGDGGGPSANGFPGHLGCLAIKARQPALLIDVRSAKKRNFSVVFVLFARRCRIATFLLAALRTARVLELFFFFFLSFFCVLVL